MPSNFPFSSSTGRTLSVGRVHLFERFAFVVVFVQRLRRGDIARETLELGFVARVYPIRQVVKGEARPGRARDVFELPASAMPKKVPSGLLNAR